MSVFNAEDNGRHPLHGKGITMRDDRWIHGPGLAKRAEGCGPLVIEHFWMIHGNRAIKFQAQCAGLNRANTHHADPVCCSLRHEGSLSSRFRIALDAAWAVQ